MTQIEDRVLLLQLERQYEALEDRVVDVEKNHDDDYCDCNCFESVTEDLDRDVDNLDERIEKLGDRVTFLDGFVVALQERIKALEER